MELTDILAKRRQLLSTTKHECDAIYDWHLFTKEGDKLPARLYQLRTLLANLKDAVTIDIIGAILLTSNENVMSLLAFLDLEGYNFEIANGKLDYIKQED